MTNTPQRPAHTLNNKAHIKVPTTSHNKTLPMLSNEAIQTLTARMSFLETHKHQLVIDGDTHPTDLNTLEPALQERYQATPFYYQGRPLAYQTLLASMAAVGIDVALTWQNPAAFTYGNDRDINFDKLYQANRNIARFAQRYPNKFIPAGWTDPEGLGLEHAMKLVELCVQEWGFSIIKMNPAQNAFPIDSSNVMRLVEKIITLGATPAFHFGGDSPYTPASGLEKVVAAFQDHVIIGVHMGGGGSHYVDGDKTYLEARALGLRYPNLFYIMSAKRDCHIESALIAYTQKGAPFNKNLAWGSDAPYGLQSWNLGGLQKLFDNLQNNIYTAAIDDDLTSLFTPQVKQNYLGTNLAEVVIQSCQRVLAVHHQPVVISVRKDA